MVGHISCASSYPPDTKRASTALPSISADPHNFPLTSHIDTAVPMFDQDWIKFWEEKKSKSEMFKLNDIIVPRHIQNMSILRKRRPSFRPAICMILNATLSIDNISATESLRLILIMPINWQLSRKRAPSLVSWRRSTVWESRILGV